MEVRVLSAALFSVKRRADDAYSLRLPLLFGSELDALGWTAFVAAVSEDLDSEEPSDRPSDLAGLPSEELAEVPSEELAEVLSDLGSDDVDSDLLSDLDSDEFFESDAADFLYDSLR